MADYTFNSDQILITLTGTALVRFSLNIPFFIPLKNTKYQKNI